MTYAGYIYHNKPALSDKIKNMRNVYVIAGGISKFAKARPDKTFPAIVKESYELLLEDLGIEPRQAFECQC